MLVGHAWCTSLLYVVSPCIATACMQSKLSAVVFAALLCTPASSATWVAYKLQQNRMILELPHCGEWQPYQLNKLQTRLCSRQPLAINFGCFYPMQPFSGQGFSSTKAGVRCATCKAMPLRPLLCVMTPARLKGFLICRVQQGSF